MEKKQFIDVQLIKALMKAKGINCKEMAKCLGVTERTVKRFLDSTDQRGMLTDRIFMIANALQVPLEVIIHKDYH